MTCSRRSRLVESRAMRRRSFLGILGLAPVAPALARLAQAVPEAPDAQSEHIREHGRALEAFRGAAIRDDGMIVVVSDRGEVATSRDGVTWSTRTPR